MLSPLLKVTSNKLENHHGHRAKASCKNPPSDRPFKRPRLASTLVMAPPFDSSSSTSSQLSNILHQSRPISTSRPSDGRSGDTLRRGHSDGDVLASESNVKSRMSAESILGDAEIWMERQDLPSRAQMAANRAAIMAADRRKRLSGHQEDQTRRRSSSSLSFVHPPSARSRHGAPYLGNDRPLVGSSGPLNSHPTQRITDRLLPRGPSIETVQNHHSREISLPRWQPDVEVSECPICGTTFSFWYRKHHCRKCGRVVCAHCCPNRITIPRQFIVHPPEDAGPSPSAPTGTGPEVVDLTGDDDTPNSAMDPQGRPRSSDYRIDPALGSGQEVRLCNPCVPDPNSLPQLPHPSSSHRTFDSFPRPDGVPSNQRHPSMPGLASSGDEQQPTIDRRVSSGRSEYRSVDASRYESSMGSLAALTSNPTNLSTNRRHSHASRPLGSPISPPGYSSMYGSAPDHTAHQVIVQCHLT